MSEHDVEQKMTVAKQKKEVGDQAFKVGETVNGTSRHIVCVSWPCANHVY